MTGIEALMQKPIEKPDFPLTTDELSEQKELPKDIETGEKSVVEPPDISFIERTSRTALLEQYSLTASTTGETDKTSTSETSEAKSEGLTEEEKAKIKEETGWSDEIIDNIQNMKQYEILKNANLMEVEINGRKCLIRTDIDLDKKWPTGKFDENGNPTYETNRERMAKGKPPLDENGRPIELHHLGQKADSPLVELTIDEHRGEGNDTVFHNKTKESEIDRDDFGKERYQHWKARSEQMNGG